jgi:exonuclease I
MKKTLQVMLCVGILFFTCSQAEAQKKKKKKDVAEKAAVVTPTEDLKSLIQKKWQLDGEFFKAEMKKEADKLKATNPEKAAEIEAQLDMVASFASSVTMEFKADGVMEMSQMGQAESGKWTLDEKAKVLTMIDTSGKETKLNIKDVSKDKLVLEDPTNESMKTIALILAK